ncbi:MAG TPA: hypothetical protein VGJ60_34155, partial [Chloroflexota bacterium]
PGQKSQTLLTHEGEYGGQQMNQSFAAYDTPLDSVNAWVDLIKNHYQGAVGAQTLGDFVHGLKQGGYFTAAEPEYLGILQGISDRVGGDVQGALQSAGQTASAVASKVGQTASNVGSAVSSTLGNVSQFGDKQLSSAEAYAACGPAAAVRFAQLYGRNPTLREATDLAAQLGWTLDGGMAGLSSESKLFDAMGIPHRTVGADWRALGREAQSGNPVVISTPGHYFTADGYDPSSGAFHVGSSGTDLRGGSEWMTPDQMQNRMGQLQGGLVADHPGVPGSSPVSAPKPMLEVASDAARSAGQAAQRGLQVLDDAVQSTAQGVQNVGQGTLQVLGDTSRQPTPAEAQPLPSEALTNPLGTRYMAANMPASPDGAVGPQNAISGQPGGNPLDQVKSKFNDALDSLGSLIQSPRVQSLPQQAADLAGQAPLPVVGGRLSDLEAPLRGTQAALDVVEQQRQQQINQPDPTSQFMRNVDAARRGDWGAFAQGTFDLTQRVAGGGPMGGPEADASQAVSAGLTAAGIDPNAARVLGQVANVIGPVALERAIPEVVGAAERAVPAAGRAITSPEAQALLRSRAVAGGRPFLFGPSEESPPTEAGAQGLEGSTAEVERLRLDKFPDWLQSTVREAAENVNFGAEQRRGVISNPQAEQMADDLQRSVDDWIARSKPGTIFNTEETRALRNVITAQAQKVQDLAQEVTQAAGRGEVTDRLTAQAAAESNKLEALVQAIEGGRAEWGRAGQAWRAATRLVDLPPSEAISEIYKALGGRDKALAAVQEFNQLIADGANPAQMANFWARVKSAPVGAEDWLKELRYNSMLSGPRTLEVNTLGNLLENVWRLGRDVPASVLRGRPEEIAPELSGMFAGFNKGARAFMETLTQGITSERAAAGELPTSLSARLTNPVGKAIATALEPPGRLIGGFDAWAQAMARGMALGRRAAVMASNEGLQGDAWHARVAELLDNPSDSMLKEARDIAQRMVFQNDMGALGNALGQVQRVPYIGHILLPFLRTVYNITARGIDRSPIGLLGTGWDVARGAYGPRTWENVRRQLGESIGPGGGKMPLGERLGDNILGSAIFGGVFMPQALSGNISASGPDDREKRDMLRAQGWQPYSLRVGGNWVSYANWGPLAIPLAMAGSLAEAGQYRKQEQFDVPSVVMDAIGRTGKLATEQSYLQSIGAIYRAIDDPERYGGQALGQTVTSLIPYGSAVNTIGQALDPYQRQVSRIQDVGPTQFLGESIESRLPGLRGNLPIAQDQLGRPVPNPQTGPGALDPLRVTPIQSNAVLQELLRNGADVGEPAPSVRGIDLTPDEQRTFNQIAGRTIERTVTELMASPGYQQADTSTRQKALQNAVEQSRALAGAQVLAGLSTEEIRRRQEIARTKRVPVPIGG